MTKRIYETDGPEAKEIAQYLPYFPFKGIPRFYDIGGFLANPDVFQKIVDIFVSRYDDIGIDSVAGYVTFIHLLFFLSSYCFTCHLKSSLIIVYKITFFIRLKKLQIGCTRIYPWTTNCFSIEKTLHYDA